MSFFKCTCCSLRTIMRKKCQMKWRLVQTLFTPLCCSWLCAVIASILNLMSNAVVSPSVNFTPLLVSWIHEIHIFGKKSRLLVRGITCSSASLGRSCILFFQVEEITRSRYQVSSESGSICMCGCQSLLIFWGLNWSLQSIWKSYGKTVLLQQKTN